MSTDTRVAVIGLGAMGLPMAIRLSGVFVVTACESDASRRDTARDNGIATDSTPAGASKDGPGPLVSTLAGRSASTFPVPIVIVPGSLSDEEIDALAG